MNLKPNLLQTLSQNLLKEKLNKSIFILSVILALFSGDIANILYESYQIEPWLFTINLLRFDFLLMIFSLRLEVKKYIGSMWYKIIVYILINNFIDRYFGITGWSWNDYITIVAVIIEYLIHKKIISKIK
jgi:hypothetical protein